jgi:hypothetical protein
MSDDYKVGYGRPPKHTRFKKGQSGNPKGRPKGRKNWATIIDETLNRKVMVRVGGKTKRMTASQCIIEKTIQQAIKGSVPHLVQVIRMVKDSGTFETPNDSGRQRSGVLVVPAYECRADWEKDMQDHQAKVDQLMKDIHSALDGDDEGK